MYYIPNLDLPHNYIDLTYHTLHILHVSATITQNHQLPSHHSSRKHPTIPHQIHNMMPQHASSMAPSSSSHTLNIDPSTPPTRAPRTPAWRCILLQPIPLCTMIATLPIVIALIIVAATADPATRPYLLYGYVFEVGLLFRPATVLNCHMHTILSYCPIPPQDKYCIYHHLLHHPLLGSMAPAWHCLFLHSRPRRVLHTNEQTT